jgi:hypothetical protein
VYWVIDINVGARSRIWRFYLFIAGSVVTTAERSMNCFFGDNLILDIILLIFFVVVLTGAWVLRECLSRIRRLALVLPKFTSLSLGQE